MKSIVVPLCGVEGSTSDRGKKKEEETKRDDLIQNVSEREEKRRFDRIVWRKKRGENKRRGKKREQKQ